MAFISSSLLIPTTLGLCEDGAKVGCFCQQERHMFPKEIVGKKITLRVLDSQYFQEYHTTFSPIVRKAIGLSDRTLDQTKEFLATRVVALKIGKTLFYCIFDNIDKKLIGAIEIREPGYPEGQLGTWINENYWGEGRYQEALDLIIKVYFKIKNVDKVNAYVETFNIRSLKAHQKYGFKIVREFETGQKKYYEIIYKKRV